MNKLFIESYPRRASARPSLQHLSSLAMAFPLVVTAVAQQCNSANAQTPLTPGGAPPYEWTPALGRFRRSLQAASAASAAAGTSNRPSPTGRRAARPRLPSPIYAEPHSVFGKGGLGIVHFARRLDRW